MKKNFRMKGNMTKIIVIFVLLLFAIGYACREELQDSLVENPAGKAAIERAKTWYEANKPEEITLRSSDGKEKIPAKPVWDYAYSMKDEKYEVVEADLMTQGIISYVNKDCMEKYKETKDRKYKQSYTRMVICTNKKTKETVGFLMTLVPNMEWLEQSNFKPFLKTNYLKRAKDYGGWILFHNLDGSFSNGWVYEQGKITGSIGSMEVEPATLSLRSEGDCYYVDYYLIIETCTDWYTKHEDGDTYNGTTCTDDLIFLYGTWVCPDGTTEGGGYYNGDGGGSGSGGGGGAGNNIPNPEQLDDPCVTGTSGNSNNNSMLSNSTIINGMDNALKNKAATSSNEWSVAVGQNPNGSYSVSGAQENGPTSGTFPSAPSGTTYVASGHSHPSGSIGVPSSGDLYTFLEQVRGNSSMQTMYVYGTGYQVVNGVTVQTPETYAINVYDRNAVSTFLNNFPKTSNLINWGNGNYNGWKDGTELQKAYDATTLNYIGIESYPFMPAAAALSFIMSNFNMGVTLSRRVDNGSFKTVNAQKDSASGKTNVSTCQ